MFFSSSSDLEESTADIFGLDQTMPGEIQVWELQQVQVCERVVFTYPHTSWRRACAKPFLRECQWFCARHTTPYGTSSCRWWLTLRPGCVSWTNLRAEWLDVIPGPHYCKIVPGHQRPSSYKEIIIWNVRGGMSVTHRPLKWSGIPRISHWTLKSPKRFSFTHFLYQLLLGLLWVFFCDDLVLFVLYVWPPLKGLT